MPEPLKYITKGLFHAIVGITPLIIILLTGCNRATDAKRAKLNDTLAKLRKHAAYIPLDSAEVYDFINKYYLPGLDAVPTGRKVFFMPLKGRDFYQVYVQMKREMEAKYYGDTLFSRSLTSVKLLPPPPIMFDTTFRWNSKKLLNTTIIADISYLNILKETQTSTIKEIKAWHKKYGYGYVCISYPQYNPYTKRLLLREWVENSDWCGTGRYRDLSFTKVAGGWKAD